MNQTLTRLGAFHRFWDDRLNAHGATVAFAAQALADPPGLHARTADAFVTGLGYQPIGGDWELLDADAAPHEPRAACDALAEAFRNDMAFPSTPWLGDDGARAMAADFLGCFHPGTRQIVTNRMYFGWNPITTATFEWAFVAFDDTAIALLLATAED